MNFKNPELLRRIAESSPKLPSYSDCRGLRERRRVRKILKHIKKDIKKQFSTRLGLPWVERVVHIVYWYRDREFRQHAVIRDKINKEFSPTETALKKKRPPERGGPQRATDRNESLPDLSTAEVERVTNAIDAIEEERGRS